MPTNRNAPTFELNWHGIEGPIMHAWPRIPLSCLTTLTATAHRLPCLVVLWNSCCYYCWNRNRWRQDRTGEDAYLIYSQQMGRITLQTQLNCSRSSLIVYSPPPPRLMKIQHRHADAGNNGSLERLIIISMLMVWRRRWRRNPKTEGVRQAGTFLMRHAQGGKKDLSVWGTSLGLFSLYLSVLCLDAASDVHHFTFRVVLVKSPPPDQPSEREREGEIHVSFDYNTGPRVAPLYLSKRPRRRMYKLSIYRGIVLPGVHGSQKLAVLLWLWGRRIWQNFRIY